MTNIACEHKTRWDPFYDSLLRLCPRKTRDFYRVTSLRLRTPLYRFGGKFGVLQGPWRGALSFQLFMTWAVALPVSNIDIMNDDCDFGSSNVEVVHNWSRFRPNGAVRHAARCVLERSKRVHDFLNFRMIIIWPQPDRQPENSEIRQLCLFSIIHFELKS